MVHKATKVVFKYYQRSCCERSLITDVEENETFLLILKLKQKITIDILSSNSLNISSEHG